MARWTRVDGGQPVVQKALSEDCWDFSTLSSPTEGCWAEREPISGEHVCPKTHSSVSSDGPNVGKTAASMLSLPSSHDAWRDRMTSRWHGSNRQATIHYRSLCLLVVYQDWRDIFTRLRTRQWHFMGAGARPTCTERFMINRNFPPP